MIFDQAEFAVRCEWGEHGVRQLALISDAIVIVDVLSFSTCIDIATARGAAVYPRRWKDKTAQTFAAQINGELAGKRNTLRGYSLSPVSLLGIPAGTRLVLPSPNGATLSLATGTTPTFTSCLRNCRAVAAAALRYGTRITVIPAGERWSDDSLRPALEDWLGAGALIHHLVEVAQLSLSPEAQLARAAFENAQSNLFTMLQQCSSGKELLERGFAADVELAAQCNVSDSTPRLHEQAFLNHHKTL